MFAALHIPEFHLQAALCTAPTDNKVGRGVPGEPSLPLSVRFGSLGTVRPTFIDPPAALLDDPASSGKAHVIELSASARRRGVETG
ncbi:MAG: hypothetical protein ACC661_07500, partial [Verrucomicrobiales bacterium]